MRESKTRISVLLSCWGDSHQMNKVVAFEKNSFQVNLLAYVRKDYYKSGVEREFIKLGTLENGNYINRFKAYLQGFFRIVKNLRKEELVYVFGLDNVIVILLLKFFFNRKMKVIYEIPDIREIQFGSSFSAKFLSYLEKMLFKRIDLFVLTSEAFYTSFYKERLGYPINFTEIENKINASVFNEFKTTNLSKIKESKSRLTIGYFGLLRCPQSLKILINLAKKRDDINIVLRGIFMSNTDSFIKEIEKIKNINYLGTYISPTDLQEMYSEIDISWICYPFSSNINGNWTLAKTNRYYESGFFNIPMISSEGTQDSKRVKKHEIGVSIDLSNIEKCIDCINDISMEDINSWKVNIASLDRSNFQIKDDYEELMSFCRR